MRWLGIIAQILTITAVLGGAGVWAGDSRWVTHDALKAQEMYRLDLRITEYRLKKDNEEATKTEIMMIPLLEAELRKLKNQQ